MTDAVSITHVTKRFGDITAVDNVTLSIPRGQILALLGHNGAGKTTLIDMILGLQTPSAGNIELLGLPPCESTSRSLVGIVYQTGSLLPNYTVNEFLSLFASLHPRSRPLSEIYAETHLESFAKTQICKLSGGEQQRVRLALALLPDPEVLFLDEPTTGMDALARRAFWELMGTQAQRGRTIIFATHYLAEAENFAQRTIIMKNGRIIADGNTADIQNHSAHATLSISLPHLAPLSTNELSRTQSALEKEILTRLPSSQGNITWEGERLTLITADTDAAAAFLLKQPGAHGLTIIPSTLEDAYAMLIDDEQD